MKHSTPKKAKAKKPSSTVRKPAKGRTRVNSSPKLTGVKKAGFLAVLAQCCNVGRACAAVQIDRTTAYVWRDRDADFAAAWDKALRVGVSALEDEAHRRAFDGVDEPVFHKGDVCGAIRKYSDTLAIFLLKAHNPDKYRDNAKLELSGRVEMADAIMAARMRGGKDA